MHIHNKYIVSSPVPVSTKKLLYTRMARIHNIYVVPPVRYTIRCNTNALCFIGSLENNPSSCSLTSGRKSSCFPSFTFLYVFKRLYISFGSFSKISFNIRPLLDTCPAAECSPRSFDVSNFINTELTFSSFIFDLILTSFTILSAYET